MVPDIKTDHGESDIFLEYISCMTSQT